MRTLTFAMLMALFVSCKVVLGPPDPESMGAEPFDPPEIHREYWAMAEECTGIKGNFDEVEFWVLPNRFFVSPEFIDVPKSKAASYWQYQRVVFSSVFRDQSGTAVDEYIHLLIREWNDRGPKSDGYHNDEYFINKCGKLLEELRNPATTP